MPRVLVLRMHSRAIVVICGCCSLHNLVPQHTVSALLVGDRSGRSLLGVPRSPFAVVSWLPMILIPGPNTVSMFQCLLRPFPLSSLVLQVAVYITGLWVMLEVVGTLLHVAYPCVGRFRESRVFVSLVGLLTDPFLSCDFLLAMPCRIVFSTRSITFVVIKLPLLYSFVSRN